MSLRYRTAACLLVAFAGCSEQAPPATISQALPAGVLARVGSDTVGAATVGRLFATRGLTAEAAANVAVSDALWAQGARAWLPRGTSRVIERAAIARSLLETLSQSAQAAGPPSEAELASAVATRWLDLARPPAVRTSHVVVMNDDPARDAAARAVGEKLAVALQGAKTSEELRRIGQAFPGEGFQLRAEALPFVTADGRTFVKRPTYYQDAGQPFDVDFARAANALQNVGDLSPLTKSKFGYHVIRMEERDPGVSVPAADLPSLLEPDVVAARARKARQELVDRLRHESNIQIERAADELTAGLQANP